MSGKSERIEQTFTGKVGWGVAGGYFKLLETVNPVTVELFLKGQRVLYAANAEGGFYNRTAFDRVEITTSGAEAVAWFYGPQEGGQDRFSGAVSILGTADVSDRAARLLGIIYGNLGQLAQQAIGGVNVLPVTQRGYTYGVKWSDNTAITAGATLQVIAAATNTNGVIVWSAESVSAYAAVTGAHVGCRLHAHTAAPAAGTDGTTLLIDAAMIAIGSTHANYYGRRDMPILLPAGLGMWFFNTNGINQAHAARSVHYTVL